MSQHPTGRHAATVIKAEVGESTKKGTPGVFFQFRTEHGDIEGSLWLSEAAYERTLNTLRTCFGFSDDFATLDAQLAGRECSITVEMEPDERGEREWPRVKWINPARGSAAKPAGNNLIARLTSQAKRIAKPAGFTPAPPRVAPSRPAPTAAINDEDVPF